MDEATGVVVCCCFAGVVEFTDPFSSVFALVLGVVCAFEAGGALVIFAPVWAPSFDFRSRREVCGVEAREEGLDGAAPSSWLALRAGMDFLALR